jgi:hypothetical protein
MSKTEAQAVPNHPTRLSEIQTCPLKAASTPKAIPRVCGVMVRIIR